MNIFEQYGIKEVADVCLYSIELDENDDEVYIPVLYLDTLKVSTVEETAEQTSARGGLGNPELIIWDYGKEITVTLEDALYSPASMGMTWGGKHGTKTFNLYGTFTFYEFDKDIYGRNIYLNDDGSVAAYTEKPMEGKINLQNFSNFGFENLDALSHPTRKYSWTSNIVLSTINSNSKYYLEDIVVTCLKSDLGNNWNFSRKNSGGSSSLEVFIQVPNNTGTTTQVKVGQFVVDKKDSKNYCAMQEIIYQIDHSLNNVQYLERIEKCKATQTFVIDTDVNTKHGNWRYLQKFSQCELTVFIDPKTMQPYEPNTDSFVRKNGKVVTGQLRVIKQHEIYYKWTRTKAIDYTTLGHQIVVDPIHFPGTYRLVGETYSRSRKTGKDERFQFEIPLCKMGTENSFTLEAEGDPTTFNMTLKVLRREDGVMMKLTQYKVENAKYDGYISGSTNVVPSDEVVPEYPVEDDGIT